MHDSFNHFPVRVRWAGWESDTHTLKRQGWQIFADERISDYEFSKQIQIAAKSPDNGLVIMGNIRLHPREFMDDKFRLVDRLCNIGVDLQSYKPTDRVHIYDTQKVSWDVWDAMLPVDGLASVDMSPQYKDIRELKIFTYTEYAKEIIVPYQTVDECLNRALQLQFPEQQKLKELIKTEKPVMQAKIYSLAA